MIWDWDAYDIDLEENDGKMWVPITCKTIEDEAMECVEAKLAMVEVEQELPNQE